MEFFHATLKTFVFLGLTVLAAAGRVANFEAARGAAR
jgi:hypothetical protein